jgi:hypothetical protein
VQNITKHSNQATKSLLYLWKLIGLVLSLEDFCGFPPNLQTNAATVPSPPSTSFPIQLSQLIIIQCYITNAGEKVK